MESELGSIQALLAGRSIDSLIDLPVMTDPATRMVMNILTNVWSPSYISGNVGLARLISATMVRLSLVHGNVEDSAYGYVTHAITVGPVLGDYKSAYEYGRLGLRVNECFNDSKLRAKIYQQFHGHVNLWRQPMQTCIAFAREACRSGLESGDFLYAGYGAVTESWPALVAAQDLDLFVRDYSPNLALVKKLKLNSFADALTLMLNWARAFQGRTKAPLSLSTDASTNEQRSVEKPANPLFAVPAFDERAYLETYHGNPFFALFYYAAKLHICYLLGDHAQALDALWHARTLAQHLSGTIWPVLVDFWGGLLVGACYASATEFERSRYRNTIDAAQTSLTALADNCPENYLCPALLLRAELECIKGRQVAALELYDRAIGYAKENHQIQYGALANELCAKLWLKRGQHQIAKAFLQQARADYQTWGAAAKVSVIERTYQECFEATPSHPPQYIVDSERSATRDELAFINPVESQHPDKGLDLFSVMKAARAIAGEIELSRLLGTLMRLALEKAGADSGKLVLEHDGELFVHAKGSLDGAEVKVLDAIPLHQSEDLPASIVNYVRRTLESVVLADVCRDDRFSNDPYIARYSPRSILCTPVLNQGRLSGVLYLENSVTNGAFNADRVVVSQLLAAHAAISLANARHYDDMKQEAVRRQKAEQETRIALGEVQQLKARLQAENVYLQDEIRREHNFEEIVGSGAALLETLKAVEQIAPTNSTVLIHGETGTGKELIARAIHSRSGRHDRPLVKVNCGAISAGLVESELFGHVRGAFTGAVDRRNGRFELADGGTLFLDEVGELPLETQVKLLRVLQEGEFEPVGSSKTVRVDVRVIAATNRQLEQAIKEGRFRADLFYRLNVLSVTVPPLRERRSDIPELAMFFLVRYATQFGKQTQHIPLETMAAMQAYDWPGNVRELQNILQRGVVLSKGSVLAIDRNLLQVQAASDGRITLEGSVNPAIPVNGEVPAPGPTALDDMQRKHIQSILEQTKGVVEGPSGAARLLQLNPNTLRSRMKKLGLR